MRWLHLHQESKSFLYGCGVDWEMVHGWRVVQLVFVYECRSIIAVLHRCPLTHSKAFCSHCGDNSCALRCDCRRKSIYPSRALLMTLPAGSVLLQQEAFSRLDGVVELGGGRGLERSRQAGRCHTTHSFFRTRAVLLTCVYWHYPWCQPPHPPPPPLARPGLSPRLTGVMVCEAGQEREGSCCCVCVWKEMEKMYKEARSCRNLRRELKRCVVCVFALLSSRLQAAPAVPTATACS